MPKFSVKENGEVIEHFESKEELAAHESNLRISDSYTDGIIYFLIGVVSTLFCLYRFGFSDASVLAKAATIISVSSAFAFVGFRYGAFIRALLFITTLLFIMGSIGLFVWNHL